ncbi:hypothetical protein [Chamaesiphon sp.]
MSRSNRSIVQGAGEVTSATTKIKDFRSILSSSSSQNEEDYN